MARTIESPVKRWPGSVSLPDYLNYPQYVAWRDGVLAAQALIEAAKENGGEYNAVEYRRAFLIGICGVVTDWHLAGLPENIAPDTFPALPNKSAEDLFRWLLAEIRLLANEVESDDPK